MHRKLNLKKITKKLNIDKLTSKHYTYIVIGLIALNVLVLTLVSKINYYKTQSYNIAKLDESKEIAGVSFKVSGVMVETGYVMGINPAENEEIISLNLTVTNKSSKNFDIYPSIQTFIRDNEGVAYYLTPVTLINPFSTNSVKPGEIISGRLSYKVTKRDIPLNLYVESTDRMTAPFIANIR